ncbi:hypothetical protein ABPG74_012456 [Tetrahymena malaccensis]
MKSIYITFALISLLATTQASDPTCVPSCENSSNPSQCQADLATLTTCVQKNCNIDKIKSGDFQAALTCLTVCKPTDDSLEKPLEDYAQCLVQNNQQVKQLVKCAKDSLLGCANNQEACQSAIVSQAQCISNKCASQMQDMTNLNDLQKCIFQTCKSSSSVLNNAEQKTYQCLTGQSISVSAKILVSSAITLIGLLILF